MLEKQEKIIKKFFEDLEININSLEININEKNICFVKLNSDDSSLLIWKYWNTIDALQKILQMILSNISDEKIKLQLEINDYHKNYEQKLFSKVDSVVDILKNTKTEYNMWKLSAYDRKRIHWYVAKNYFEIISKSKWEWENRELFLIYKKDIKPKSKLTIDIDWDNI